jgi:hypothetical protein
MSPIPTFTSVQSQGTSPVSYFITYSGTKYNAKIKGTCKPNRIVFLD